MSDPITSSQLAKAYDAGYRYFPKHAEYVVDFFPRFLRHSKGAFAGKPFELLEWQKEKIIRPLFGWRNPATGARLYRKVLAWVPKKNGKSTIAAGVGLYMLIGDGEGGAEVYSAATDKDQAQIVHGEAINMVEASPYLSKRLEVHKTHHRIRDAATKSKYRAIAHNPEGNEGLNSHCTIIDELHAWSSRAFWDVLRYAGAARHQPLLFVISTAGVYNEQAIGWEQYCEAKGILDGTIDDPYTLAVVYEAPRGAPFDDPLVWRAANPSFEITLNPIEMAQSCNEARRLKRTELTFRRYRLNEWVDQADHWLPHDLWNAAAAPELRLEDFSSLWCYLGLDLSSTTDLTALVLLARRDNGEVIVWPTFWIPESKVTDPRDGADYRTWAREGIVRVCAGDSIRDDDVLARITELFGKFAIVKMAFDRWNGAHIAEKTKNEIGIETGAFQQSPRHYHEPCTRLEKLLVDGQLRHPGNPCLSWNALNAVTKSDQAGHIMPTKPSSSRRIDGVAAMLMALAAWMFQPGAGGQLGTLDSSPHGETDPGSMGLTPR